MNDNKNSFKITKKLDFSCISITGNDATNFLQNQFTNNINELGENSLSHQLNGYCSPKGRLIAVVRVLFISKNNFILLIPQELSPSFLKRLKMFVLRSNVEIEDVSKKEHIYGVWSDDNLLKCDIGESLEFDNLIFFKTSNYNGIGSRFWVKLNSQNSQSELIKSAFFNNKSFKIKNISSQDWFISEMLCGLPWIFNYSTEKFIPQSINLDLVDGVSFNKGCYPGQEVVARMHFLGKNKKRVFLAKIFDLDYSKNIKTLQNNELIYLKNEKFNDHNEKFTEIGQIVMSSKFNDDPSRKFNSFIFLIQIQINAFFDQKKPKLAIKICDDFLNLELIPLPYEDKILIEIEKK